MANPKNKKEEAAAKQPSLIVIIIAGLIVTLVAAGGGGALGMMLAQMVQAPEPAKQEAQKPEGSPEEKPVKEQPKNSEAAAKEESEAEPLVLKPMPPILANLAAPPGAWIRIEASLLLDNEGAKNSDILAAKTGEDILSFLRTVSLAQIEGASGYLHLREDLADLVQFKSEGHVRALVMQSMVVE
jgi:flagellar protein FliL